MKSRIVIVVGTNHNFRFRALWLVGFSLLLPTPTIYLSSRSRKRDRKKWKRFVFSVELMTLLTDMNADFHWVISSIMTPTTTPTPSPRKTSLKRWKSCPIATFQLLRLLIPCTPSGREEQAKLYITTHFNLQGIVTISLYIEVYYLIFHGQTTW